MKNNLLYLTLFHHGFLRVAQLGGGGGGEEGAESTINDNEMKLSGVVKDH